MEMDLITKLNKDLREAAKNMDKKEVRLLVDRYYQMQFNRIRAAAQVRAASEGKEPSLILVHALEQAEKLENQIKVSLDVYSNSQPMGRWCRDIVGIGPVIASGLLTYLDIEKADTAGHFWSYAGIVGPSQTWGKGEKCPWNIKLKTLCVFKLGESFVKTSNHENSIYGKMYKERKALEWDKNQKGEYYAQAEAVAAKVGKDTETYKWATAQYNKADFSGTSPKGVIATGGALGVEMLSPAHIHARARRYAVKMFLSHLHQRWYEFHYNKPAPAPYMIAHKGHVHIVPAPEFHHG